MVSRITALLLAHPKTAETLPEVKMPGKKNKAKFGDYANAAAGMIKDYANSSLSGERREMKISQLPLSTLLAILVKVLFPSGPKSIAVRRVAHMINSNSGHHTAHAAVTTELEEKEKEVVTLTGENTQLKKDLDAALQAETNTNKEFCSLQELLEAQRREAEAHKKAEAAAEARAEVAAAEIERLKRELTKATVEAEAAEATAVAAAASAETTMDDPDTAAAEAAAAASSAKLAKKKAKKAEREMVKAQIVHEDALEETTASAELAAAASEKVKEVEMRLTRSQARKQEAAKAAAAAAAALEDAMEE